MKSTYIAFIGFISVLFANIQNELFAVYVLIGAYTVVGLWARFKTGDKKIINWSKFFAKVVVYPMALVSAKVSEDMLISNIPWADVITGTIAAYEFYILVDNLKKIFGINFTQILKDLIGRISPNDKNNDKGK